MKKTIEEIALNAVDCIVADLSDRCGLQNEWEAIDKDTQQEIKDTWCEIIKKHVKELEEPNVKD